MILLWLGRDHTTVVSVLTRPLGVTLLILITRHACMLELTSVASMVKLCQGRYTYMFQILSSTLLVSLYDLQKFSCCTNSGSFK